MVLYLYANLRGLMLRKKKKEALIKEGFKSLERWVNAKNFEVDYEYNTVDYIDEDERQIIINTRSGAEIQLYALLHECGHLIIRKSKDYKSKYPVSCKLQSKNKQIEGSIAYKMDVVREEIEAWDKGKDLAKRLNIHLDEQKFLNLVNKCVMTYIEWAAKPGYSKS